MPIYMDNAASTRVNPAVLAKFNEVAKNLYGNPSSGMMKDFKHGHVSKM